MLRFYHGRILTMDAGSKTAEGEAALRYTATEPGETEVWVDGDKVSYVGPPRPDMPVFEREIDLDGDMLMPGFKNAHTHSAMTFCRSLADDVPLQPWLFEQIFPLEEKLTPERTYRFTQLAILEYVSSGITAAFDMYYHRDMGARACIESGFRYVFCGLTDPPEVVEEDYLKFNSLHPLISLIPGIHAEYTSNREKMGIVCDLVHKYSAPFFTHNAETRAEVEGCRERWGMTPTELFDSLGLFDYGGGGYHCVWLTERDLDIFQRRGLYLVTCPASNAKLASGVAPLTECLKRGIPLAIGTDGPSSNNALDMFREMYLACVLQKLKTGDAAACDAGHILEAACCGSARAMGLRDCDCIAPGKQADLVVIDMHRPNMRPVLHPAKNLVYAGSKENVRLTMVAGKILYENGEFFIGEDPARIYAAAEAEVRRMLEE